MIGRYFANGEGNQGDPTGLFVLSGNCFATPVKQMPSGQEGFSGTLDFLPVNTYNHKYELCRTVTARYFE